MMAVAAGMGTITARALDATGGSSSVALGALVALVLEARYRHR
jgi:hypothetical protein